MKMSGMRLTNVTIKSENANRLPRSLLDSSGNVLTNESGIPLQHNLPTEDDMLYTDFMPNYFQRLEPIVISSDTYVDVTTLQIPDTLAGVYQYTVSFVFNNPDTNDSLYWQITGTYPSPPNFSRESTDASDTLESSYTTQFVHTGGAITATLQMRKEDGNAGDLEVIAGGQYLTRVG